MSDKATDRDQQAPTSQDRFVRAEKNLQRLQKTIAPFVKRRKFMRVSTEGQWCQTSSLARPGES